MIFLKEIPSFTKKRSMIPIRGTLLALLLAGSVFVAQAGEILDDSLSPKKQYSVQFEWAHKGDLSALSKDEFYRLKAYIPDVKVRLNTADYMGKQARIYLALPQTIDGLSSTEGFSLNWETDRIFSSGRTTPGNRALIFDGKIDSPIMIDLFTFTLKINASYLTGKLRYAPIFEIETY